MIYILFGEMGVGKNYVGEKLAKKLNGCFWDGDDAIPEEMKKKVKNFKPLSDEMLTDYVQNLFIPMVQFQVGIPNLVVSQALYKKKHRKMVEEAISDDIKWIYIKPPSLRVHMSGLLTRPSGWKWMAYCLLSKPFFQKPVGVYTVVNSTDKEIARQIEEIVGHGSPTGRRQRI